MKNVSDTLAIRVYGPYAQASKLAWWVLVPGKGKKVFSTKLDMLTYLDKVTTVPK
jgi:hypothetical protein